MSIDLKYTSQQLTALGIKRPTLLIDPHKAKRNIARMARKARKLNVRLRPHFKTHQSIEIGSWFREHEINAITVSSLEMARYFAMHGWQDILVAFPLNILEMDTVNELAAQIRLAVLVDSETTVEALIEKAVHPLQVWIEIEAGYRRSGVSWLEVNRIAGLIAGLNRSPHLKFAGLLTHAGNTYQATSTAEIQRIQNETLLRLGEIKRHLQAQNVQNVMISIGDTPAATLLNDFPGVDEIRPGNFVFFDLVMDQLGVCTPDDIAVAVACPVVGKYLERRQAVIYGGAIHFSKDFLVDAGGRKVFGYVTGLRERTWHEELSRDMALISLSQEHGILQAPETRIHEIRIGDILLILPAHSCLTADNYSYYTSLDGRRIERFSLP